MRRVASLAVMAAVGEVTKKVPARSHAGRRRRVRGEVATVFPSPGFKKGG